MHVQKVAVVWMLLLTTHLIASIVTNALLCAERTDGRYSRLVVDKLGFFTTYSQVVNMLSKNYAIDEIIAETKYKSARFQQSLNMTPSWHLEELVWKTYRCRDIYKQYADN